MSQKPSGKLKPSQLRDAYKSDLAAAWTHSRKLHPTHQPYAFFLYGIEGGESPQLIPYVLTEEALSQVAQSYVDKGYHETLDEARKALRYSAPDSPHEEDLLSGFTPASDALIELHLGDFVGADDYAPLAKAAIDALMLLDKEGFFGSGKARNNIVLAIVTEATEYDWSDASAKKLNPPEVFKRFKDHNKVQGPFASTDSLAVGADGFSLYRAGSKEDPSIKKGDDQINEVVAYDIKGMRLVRRWTYTPPRTDHWDGIGNLSYTSTKQIIGLRKVFAKVPGQNQLATLFTVIRFGLDSQTPLEELNIPAEKRPEDVLFAASNDGSIIALHFQKKLHLLDKGMNLLHAIKWPARPTCLRFLRGCDLLVATEKCLTRINPTTGATALLLKRAFSSIATDDRDRYLVGSRPYFLNDQGRKVPDTHSVEVYKLPEFKLIHRFATPQVHHPGCAISPNGKWIAFCNRQLPGYSLNFMSVFEIATGTAIAGRKISHTREFEFLRDNKTLAIGQDGFTASEPILLWRFNEC